MQLVLPFEQYGKELKRAVNTITENIKQDIISAKKLNIDKVLSIVRMTKVNR